MKIKTFVVFALLLVALQTILGCNTLIFSFDNSTPGAAARTFVNALIQEDKSSVKKLVSPELDSDKVVKDLAPWFSGKDLSNVMFTKKAYSQEQANQPYVAIVRPDAFKPLTTVYITLEPGTKGFLVTKYTVEHQ